MTSATNRCRELYLDLIVRCIRNELYSHPAPAPTEADLLHCRDLLAEARSRFAAHAGTEAFEAVLSYGPERLHNMLHEMSRDAHTMTQRSGIRNFRRCIETVIADDIPGDIVEAGVWRGGLCVLAAAILEAWEVDDRRVWLCDSFEGLPEPDPEESVEDAIGYFLAERLDHLRVDLAHVKDVFRRYGLLDDRVRFLKGWFRDTLPTMEADRLAVIRLDGDWYDSTRDALNALYPKLSPGGFAIIDDYGLPLGCRRAVDEFREQRGIEEKIVRVDEQTVYWRRAGAPAGP